MSTRNKTGEMEQFDKLREGLTDVVGTSATFSIQGKEVKVSELLDSLNALLANARATDQARAELRRALGVERAHREVTLPTLVSVRTQLRATLSDAKLAACGLTPMKKKRVLTSEERTAALAKLRENRKKNRTRGARQIRMEKAKAVLAATYASSDPPGEAPTPAPSAPSATSPPGAAAEAARGS